MISEYNHNCNLQKTKQTPDETELDRANKNSMSGRVDRKKLGTDISPQTQNRSNFSEPKNYTGRCD
jgi:hypothetical protein